MLAQNESPVAFALISGESPASQAEMSSLSLDLSESLLGRLTGANSRRTILPTRLMLGCSTFTVFWGARTVLSEFCHLNDVQHVLFLLLSQEAWISRVLLFFKVRML